jgi:hypothetical protein
VGREWREVGWRGKQAVESKDDDVRRVLSGDI